MEVMTGIKGMKTLGKNVVNSRNKMDILKSAALSVHDKYFHGNSKAYGNLPDEESPPEDPAISYFMGDA
jgi:hypothetical protein